MKLSIVMSTLSTFAVCLTIAQAQPYILRRSTISSGGGKAASAKYSTTSLAGMPAIGKGSSSAYNQQEGFWSPSTTAEQTITAAVSVSDRWNLVSVPVQVSDYAKTSVYPTATSAAYAYAGFYATQTTLTNGKGYWLKFNGAQIVPMTGINLSVDSLVVTPGWNLIGSISSTIAVSTITSNPGGIVTSDFYGFTDHYSITDSIRLGKGYWVKVNQSGKLILSASTAITPTNRIRIISGSEKPPAPPTEPATNTVREIPKEYSLNQNYPNPFNPTTTLKFDLPEPSRVTLKIYTILGEEVGTLFNNQQLDAGRYDEVFNASRLASGVYFYRLQAEAVSGSRNYIEIRKMALIK